MAHEGVELAPGVGQGEGEPELDLLGELAVVQDPGDLLAVGDLEEGDGLFGIVVAAAVYLVLSRRTVGALGPTIRCCLTSASISIPT